MVEGVAAVEHVQDVLSAVTRVAADADVACLDEEETCGRLAFQEDDFAWRIPPELRNADHGLDHLDRQLLQIGHSRP